MDTLNHKIACHLAITEKSYLGNDKHLEANTQALHALRQTFSKEHLFIVSHCDYAFVVWNTLISPEQQTINNVERESSGDESDQALSSKGMTPLR